MKANWKFLIIHPAILVFITLFSVSTDAQVIYTFGNTGGVLNTNGTSGLNPAILNNYPVSPLNIKFFYGISQNANAMIKGSYPGLFRLGDSSEVQACAGNGANEFVKFGIMRYSSQGTLFSYVRFDAVFAGDSLASSNSNSGAWYFFIGDGGTTSQFMANDTISKKIQESGTSLRWTYNADGSLSFARYDYAAANWVDITGMTWSQKKKYSIEIYANYSKNAGASVIFKRAGVFDTLASKTMSIYVNNNHIENDVNVSQYDNQTLNFKKADSYCWYGEGSNNAWIFVDNAVGADAPPSTYAYYTIRPANGTTLDLSQVSSWTSSWNGTGGTAPNQSAFDSANVTWFIRNYAGTTGVTFTLSSGNLNITRGGNSQIELGDSGQIAVFRIPSGKSCLGDMDVRAYGDLIIESTILPNIRTTNTNSTVEYNNGDAQITYPLYYNLKINSGSKTIATNYIIDGTATVGDGTNSASLTIPANYGLTGNVAVKNNAALTLQNSTSYPVISSLESGSTVVYNGTSQQVTQSGIDYYNITINNSSGVVLANNTTVSGYLSMSSGNFILNDKTLTINGTVSGSGGYFYGSPASGMTVGGSGNAGTITFASGGRILNIFTLNRSTSGIITLGSCLNVTGTLNLSNGILNINSSSDSLILGSSSLAPGTLTFPQSGPNYSSWIKGKIQRFISSGTSSVLFPIGSLNFWEGVNLIYPANTLTGGTISAAFILGDPLNYNTDYLVDSTEPGNPNYRIDRYSRYGYWTLRNSSVTGTYEINADAYNFTGINSDSIKSNKIRLLKRTDGTSPWTLQGSHKSASGNPVQITAKRTGLTTFSDFTLGSNSNDNILDGMELPVTLNSFTGSIKGRDVYLKWITTSELNNAGFFIERKNNDGGWSNLVFIKSTGNSGSGSTYTYYDRNIRPGKYDYRLKQMDINGNTEYFNLGSTIEIELPKKYILSQNYPNPFNPSTKIDFSLPVDSKVTIKVYDVNGRMIVSIINDEFRKADIHTVEFDASKLSSGVYFYRISAGTFTQTNKMVLLK